MNKQVLISVIASAVIAALIAFGGPRAFLTPPTPASSPSYGALVGPNIPSPFLKWGDVATYNAAFAFSGATSTDSWSPICSLQGPTSTSTLTLDTGIFFLGTQNATTSSAKIRVFKGETSQATTTLLFAKNVTDKMSGVRATSTEAAGASDTTTANAFIIPPDWYINFTVEGLANSHGRFIGSGTCQAGFVTSQ